RQDTGRRAAEVNTERRPQKEEARPSRGANAKCRMQNVKCKKGSWRDSGTPGSWVRPFLRFSFCILHSAFEHRFSFLTSSF
ncbi:MAG: hypothetical protein ACRD2J_09685, partial [Thermoanaerobaculia bacterium]